MAERKKKRDSVRRALERAEDEIRNDPNLRSLQERIAYHKAKLEEERTEKQG